MTRAELMPTRAAILAGGRGVRLGRRSLTVPKVLQPVQGKPFLEHLLCALRKQGIGSVVLCGGHLADQLDAWAHLARRRLKLDIVCSVDPGAPDQLSGTAGALRSALHLLPDPFWVFNGDTFVDVDLAEVWRQFGVSSAAGPQQLMVVFRNRNRVWPSNVTLRGGIITAYNKLSPTTEMEHIDAGVALLGRHELMSSNDRDLEPLFTRLADRGDLAGFEAPERMHEINTEAGLREAEAFFAAREGFAPPRAAR